MWKIVFIICTMQSTDCKAIEFPIEGEPTPWACSNAGQTLAMEYLKNRKGYKVTKWSCQREKPNELNL